MNFIPRALTRKTPSSSAVRPKPVPKRVPISTATNSSSGSSLSTENKHSLQQESTTEISSAYEGKDLKRIGTPLEQKPKQSLSGCQDIRNKQEEHEESLPPVDGSHKPDSCSLKTENFDTVQHNSKSTSSNIDLNDCSDGQIGNLQSISISQDHLTSNLSHAKVPSEKKVGHSQLTKLEQLHHLDDAISNKLRQINEIRGKQGEALILSNSKSDERTCEISHSASNHSKSSHSGVDRHNETPNQSGRHDGSDKEDDSDEDDGDRPPIVSFSKNQRWPEEDEPVCVICGKYGEYICDQTEADVCSLECKARNLVQLKHPVSSSKNVELLPADDSEEISAPQGGEPSVDTASHSGGDDSGPYVYTEHGDVSDLSNEQIQEIRNEVQIFVEGSNVQRHVMEFEHLNLPRKLQQNLTDCGYITPTPVQMQAIPSALGMRDLMVCAQTSSGKTASFLIPLIITIYNQVMVAEDDERKSPYGLILTPTRELAMQIEEQAKQLMKGMTSMRTALLVGGLPLPPQLHRLKQGIQLIVATPGRMLEIIRQQAVTLSEIKLVVIDEVDTMLQLGFQQQVYDIMVHLPDNHQTLLFSATIPPSIEKMASTLLNNPIYISVGTPSTPCSSVKQLILWVEDPSKKKKLFAILQDPKHFRPPAIVFVDSKFGADLLAQAIEKTCGLAVASLHGDKPQQQRSEILKLFKEKAYEVLVSTSVLGRGIDIPGVKMIINFDMPGSVEEYIHQIGRTGRLGSSGTAMTFINNNSKRLFLEFTSVLKPMGVVLPQELVNSPHLHYQKQRHRTRSAHNSQRGGHTFSDHGRHNYHVFSAGTHRKRKNDRENVADMLKHRKRKFKP